MTSQPALASLRAIARPMPRAAPVTSAVRPASGSAAPARALWDEVDIGLNAEAPEWRGRNSRTSPKFLSLSTDSAEFALTSTCRSRLNRDFAMSTPNPPADGPSAEPAASFATPPLPGISRQRAALLLALALVLI